MLTYVSIASIDCEGDDILYAGSDKDEAFKSIKDCYELDDHAADNYYVKVWKDGISISRYDYNCDEDKFYNKY